MTLMRDLKGAEEQPMSGLIPARMGLIKIGEHQQPGRKLGRGYPFPGRVRTLEYSYCAIESRSCASQPLLLQNNSGLSMLEGFWGGTPHDYGCNTESAVSWFWCALPQTWLKKSSEVWSVPTLPALLLCSFSGHSRPLAASTPAKPGYASPVSEFAQSWGNMTAEVAEGLLKIGARAGVCRPATQTGRHFASISFAANARHGRLESGSETTPLESHGRCTDETTIFIPGRHRCWGKCVSPPCFEIEELRQCGASRLQVTDILLSITIRHNSETTTP
ncbi:hypothetical protein QBC35DRAFT_532225 [Podospora australis]|uniref:Uncharacterized protein n=1 Tax=Podospora australis TaxID=1536484 RepID=A0AAN6WTB0_9PEZI|nr:hypothetical protein QBC35DRAFT_532225 [Podospora australis]